MGEETNKVSWNIAGEQAKHVFKLINKATTSYLQGDLGKWYWTLSALRENVNHEIKELKRTELNGLELKCNRNLSAWKRYHKSVKEGVKNKKLLSPKSVFAKEVRTYQRALMDELKNLGFFPNKEDRTKLNF